MDEYRAFKIVSNDTKTITTNTHKNNISWRLILYLFYLVMKYQELMKRKDREIINCQDIRSVLRDLKTEILSVDEAMNMLHLAMQNARREGYYEGWEKTKQIKNR